MNIAIIVALSLVVVYLSYVVYKLGRTVKEQGKSIADVCSALLIQSSLDKSILDLFNNLNSRLIPIENLVINNIPDPNIVKPKPTITKLLEGIDEEDLAG